MHQTAEIRDDVEEAHAPAHVLESRNPYGVPHEEALQGVVEALVAENEALRRAVPDDLVARERLRLNRTVLMNLSVATSNLRQVAALSAFDRQDAEAAQGAALRLVHSRPETGAGPGGPPP